MSLKIAIVGATGLVGRKMLEILHQIQMDIDQLFPFASAKSEGLKCDFFDIPIIAIEDAKIPQCDYALFAVEADISRIWACQFVSKGAFVIDNSSAFRMDDDVPLIVPEVNGQNLPADPCIIANPNCSTIQLVLPLKPIAEQIGIRKVHISTYQAVSGAGQSAIDDLYAQSNGDSHGYSVPIHQNIVPQIGIIEENGFSQEEMKLINETRKILELPNLAVYPTTVRVPVINGHSESVSLELSRETSVSEICDLLEKTDGIVVSNEVITPYEIDGRDEVFVCRIRQNPDDPKNILMWIVADNLRKGAATNAVQILELLIARGVR